MHQASSELKASEQHLTEVKERLQTAERELRGAQRQLSQTDDVARTRITELFGSQGTVFQILAKQSAPRSEWTFLLREIRQTLKHFLASERNRQELPFYFARALLYQGQLELMLGSLDESSQSLNKAERLSNSLADGNVHAAALNSLGCVSVQRGDFSAAESWLIKATDHYGTEDGPHTAQAIAWCNLGLVRQAMDKDGSEDVRRSVRLLESGKNIAGTTSTSELAIDFQMILAEMLWRQKQANESHAVVSATIEDLRELLQQMDHKAVNKHLLARNRVIEAIGFAQRDLATIAQASDAEPTAVVNPSPWQWRRLVDNATDLVPLGQNAAGTMVAEFERQNGFAIGWGMFDWTHDAAVEIASHLARQSQLVLVADNSYSLDKARATFQNHGISVENIQFQITDCETPWFRDYGPIVSQDAFGTSVWFDSKLTRPDRDDRMVLDALPQQLQRDWKTRVVETPIHLEGGTILTNGNNIVIVSSDVLAINQRYGLDESFVRDQIKRITGCEQIVFVDTLIGEKTKHVDLFLCFTDSNTVVVGQYEDGSDPNAALLDRIATQLSRLETNEAALKVVRLPMPRPFDGCFPTYTNVIFANGVLLVPSYQSASNDSLADAMTTYQMLLPDWEVIPIDSTSLCVNGGALHCVVSNLGRTTYAPLDPLME
ncbi:agmatine deiminase family protein [Rhodopirellula sp. MGV]|uniref:agmatine deiminase family protein n=1 Tax=Rhodopirellula sp. MGV TaxID=2023130 RepID=UPI00117AA140|nr:agmatine deiminase family protein [Rhodopirellula sp. MGV]